MRVSRRTKKTALNNSLRRKTTGMAKISPQIGTTARICQIVIRTINFMSNPTVCRISPINLERLLTLDKPLWTPTLELTKDLQFHTSPMVNLLLGPLNPKAKSIKNQQMAIKNGRCSRRYRPGATQVIPRMKKSTSRWTS